MLKISADQLAAFERAAELHQQVRFGRWLASHAAIIGNVTMEAAASAFAAAVVEGPQGGIDTEPRLFAYAAARCLMPDMQAIQYLEVMDVVFAPLSDDDRLTRLLAVAGSRHG